MITEIKKPLRNVSGVFVQVLYWISRGPAGLQECKKKKKKGIPKQTTRLHCQGSCTTIQLPKCFTVLIRWGSILTAGIVALQVKMGVLGCCPIKS